MQSIAHPSDLIVRQTPPTPGPIDGVESPSLRQRAIAALTRLYPLYSGRGRIANHPLVERLAGQSQAHVWSKITGGEVIAPLDDHVGRAAFFCGDLDPKVTWVFRKLLRRGDTVLDIGANIGVTTVAMASFVGTGGHVHSFEPNPVLQDMLRRVIARNQFGNVTLHPMALGSADGELELRVPKANFGMGSLVRHANPDDAVHSVPVRRLTDVIAEEGIKSIRLIKIDVEGFEADVFSGAGEVLSQTKPQAILFELNQEAGEFGDQPVVRILNEAGYEFFTIPCCKVRMTLHPMDLRDALPPRGNDYLAVRRDELGQEIKERVGLA